MKYCYDRRVGIALLSKANITHIRYSYSVQTNYQRLISTRHWFSVQYIVFPSHSINYTDGLKAYVSQHYTLFITTHPCSKPFYPRYIPNCDGNTKTVSTEIPLEAIVADSWNCSRSNMFYNDAPRYSITIVQCRVAMCIPKFDSLTKRT